MTFFLRMGLSVSELLYFLLGLGLVYGVFYLVSRWWPKSAPPQGDQG